MIKIDKVEIPNHEGYKATPDGKIIGKRGKPLIGHVDRCGYREVTLCENGKCKLYRVHRLIAETFIPNCEKLPCVNHKDGNKLNNSVDNLEWCTHSENTLHAYENGLERKVCGEEHHAHKLDWEKVRYIRRVYQGGSRTYGASALARRFGVDRSTISAVVFNETWRENNDK